MQQGRAQAILLVFEIIKDIDPNLELIKFEDSIAYLELKDQDYSEDLHIKIQERIDAKLEGVSVYFT